MSEVDVNHPLYVEALTRNLQRITACSHTISMVRDEILDPGLVERQADLLLAVEDLVNETMTLALDVRSMVWPDKQAHPAGKDTE